MSGLKGNVNDLRNLRKRLGNVPVVLAQQVAKASAPELTALTQQAFSAGQNVYGDARPQGKSGPLDLHETGATQRTLSFTSVGTIVRCVLGTRYAKYLIGKYRVLPMGNMPVKWSTKLANIVSVQKVDLK